MKPDDISQEVWDEALVASDEAGQAMGSIWGSEFGAVVIARAIQRAVEREREEIEAMVDNMSFCTPDDDYQLGYTNCTEAVVDAIRARGK